MRRDSRRLPIRRSDLAGSTCTVPEECADALDRRETVTVTLEHREHGLMMTRPVFAAALRQDVEWQLHGVEWPADLRPGTLVTIACRSEGVVLRTVALDEPLRIDGVDYFHEYDPKAVTRDVAEIRSNRGKVLHAVRRMGRVFDDGSAVFVEADLVKHSGLGRGAKGMFLLSNAVDQLLREGYVTRVAGSVGPDGRPNYPAAEGEEPADMLFYAPLIEPAPYPGEDAERSEHWVNGFVRRLPAGAQPSPKQLTLAQQAMEAELEPGYTFVKKHHRKG